MDENKIVFCSLNMNLKDYIQQKIKKEQTSNL